jgi:hypothetical protein
MDPHALAPYAPYLLFAAAAATLFWVGRILAGRRSARVFAGDSMSLMQAAQEAYDAARRENLVVVSVAEKSSQGALDWFARSIASVVPVYRAGGVRAQERYAGMGGIGADLQSLYIERRDIRTYLRWARTVQ